MLPIDITQCSKWKLSQPWPVLVSAGVAHITHLPYLTDKLCCSSASPADADPVTA